MMVTGTYNGDSLAFICVVVNDKKTSVCFFYDYLTILILNFLL